MEVKLAKNLRKGDKVPAGHTKQDDAQFESGERCLICYERTAEPYGRPGACEDCGGDFVLYKNTDDYKMRAMADELKDRGKYA